MDTQRKQLFREAMGEPLSCTRSCSCLARPPEIFSVVPLLLRCPRSGRRSSRSTPKSKSSRPSRWPPRSKLRRPRRAICTPWRSRKPRKTLSTRNTSSQRRYLVRGVRARCEVPARSEGTRVSSRGSRDGAFHNNHIGSHSWERIRRFWCACVSAAQHALYLGDSKRLLVFLAARVRNYGLSGCMRTYKT